MTPEQKAEAYDRALEYAKSALDCLADDYVCNHLTKDDIRGMYAKLFHELGESEDESKKIQKALINIVECAYKGGAIIFFGEKEKEKYIAWLKKQGKIAPTEDELEALRIAAYEPTKNWSEKLQSLYEKLTHCEQGVQKPVISYDALREGIAHFGITQYQIDNWLKKYVDVEKQCSKDNDEDVDILQRFSFYSYKDEPNILYLSGLYVNEEYRNKGIGTKILEVADEVAKSLNCFAIRLETKKDSNAERLYQTHGYNRLATGERDDIWLEKQGNPPADKVKPKFKVGDWCIDNEDGTIFQIVKVLDNTYAYKTNEGKEYSGTTHYSLENDARLWTIEDAKPGDILATPIDVLIFKNHLPKNGGVSYCHYTFHSGLDYFNYNEDNNWYFGEEDVIHPATKEQCDTLFAKMKESGYEWVADKKELKKIIDEKQIKKNLQDNGFRRMLEQTPAEWHREDEQNLNACLSHIPDEFLRRWLKDAIHTRFDKPIDKPKFNIGDWVVDKNGLVKQILSYKDGVYKLTDGYSAKKFEDEWRLWVIDKDAKAGAVLVSKDGYDILIFKSIKDNTSFTSHYNIARKVNNHWSKSAFIPATKEQRDLLFQKMKEDGYEWDAEKKAVQNLADKAETKFHEGDWVVYKNDVCQIVKREEGCNRLVTVFGIEKELVNERNLSTARLWSIQDAREGDVLVHNGCTFIFIGIKNGIVQALEEYLLEGTNPVCFGDPDRDGDYHPATKEQRDDLMKSMAERGYEWDSKNKGLKKIVQKPVVIIPKFRVGDEVVAENEESLTITRIDEKGYWSNDLFICDFDSECIWDLVEPTPTWSEADELQMQGIINLLPGLTNRHNWLKSLKERVGCEADCTTTKEWSEDDDSRLKEVLYYIEYINRTNVTFQQRNLTHLINWLKSFKGRVQPQQEWSEEDKKMLDKMRDYFMRFLGDKPDFTDDKRYEGFVEFIDHRLKSIRPQSQWKPSDEQLTWLYRAADDASKDSRMKQILNELLSDLKKLTK